MATMNWAIFEPVNESGALLLTIATEAIRLDDPDVKAALSVPDLQVG